VTEFSKIGRKKIAERFIEFYCYFQYELYRKSCNKCPCWPRCSL